jgi:hypothetical protein
MSRLQKSFAGFEIKTQCGVPHNSTEGIAFLDPFRNKIQGVSSKRGLPIIVVPYPGKIETHAESELHLNDIPANPDSPRLLSPLFGSLGLKPHHHHHHLHVKPLSQR